MRKAIPKATRELVKARFGGRCGYCGHLPKVLHIDHVKPYNHESYYERQGGPDPHRIENLMPACAACNNYKMTHSLEMFRSELGEQIKRVREHSVNFRLAERFGLIELREKPIVFYFEKEPAAQAVPVEEGK